MIASRYVDCELSCVTGYFITGKLKSSTTALSTACAHKIVDRQRPLGGVDVVAPRPGRGMLRREELAAVLILDDRDGIGAEPLRLGRDLVLVHADQRPEDRQRRHRSDRRQVLERLRRHLPDRLRRSPARRACAVSRNRLRRCAASAAGRSTTRSGGGTASITCCWISPNATMYRRVCCWYRVSSAASSRTFSCDARDRIGIAVEVHRNHAAAAPHQPVRGHRRIDAARQQARRRGR